MPSANLDLVRSICEPWERGDFGSAEWVHPEIEFVAGDGLTPGRTWKGLAGLTVVVELQHTFIVEFAVLLRHRLVVVVGAQHLTEALYPGAARRVDLRSGR
jgi:hypothetical protein